MKALLMADQSVGFEITQWLISEYRQDISLVVTISENEILELAKKFNIDSLVFESNSQIYKFIQQLDFDFDFDFGFLLWWPKLIKKPLLNMPKYGFINTHPSFLPHNRGKHYNFWALVEQCPFGVSLHFVEEGIDNGDIVSQTLIPYTWEDTGESLYNRAKYEMVNLFKNTYPVIRALNIRKQIQDLKSGSFHLANEINDVSHINIEDNYKAKDLLNLLRARTFSGHPACWFKDGINEYEVRVKITKKERNDTI